MSAVERPCVQPSRRGGDDVEVGEEQQRVAAGAVAPEPRDHAAPAGRRLEDLGREAGVAQLGRDQLGRPRAPGRAGPAG